MTQRAASATFACLAGGGTAGHVLPGLAIAEALVRRGHDREGILFVGSERGIEGRLVPEAGFELAALPGRGVQRRFTLANVGAVAGILVAVVRAIRLVRQRRPRVVLSLGGYASVPCTIAAVLWRVPIVVAEQNARAGSANRLAGRFARACAVPVEGTDLPRAVVTGNPVRDEILAVDRDAERDEARAELGLPTDRVVVAVATGSLGARRVNRAVRQLAGRWADRSDVAIYHVSGTRDHEELLADAPVLSEGGLDYRLVSYEDRMARLLAAADVAICRGGATTLSELVEVGMPALVVPLPSAPRDHQRANAEPLVAVGGAILVPDAECDVDRLADELEPLVADPQRLRSMAARLDQLAHPDAADRVATLLEEHARG